MLNLSDLNLSVNENKVFEYFSEICKIPHGSGNMKKIASYIENFAKKFNLRYIRDNSDNLIIFKNGCLGGENAEPIILQGHIDMVCQCDQETVIDFENDSLKIFRDGDFIKAKGTTLGGDNGIAVAYIMAILSADDIPHPPIEAIFTTDEEIGLLGANALDTSVLRSKKMINIDSESDDILTVSCAGGQDVTLTVPVGFCEKEGTKFTISIKGLLGGHSGMEIDKCRTNANILMGKILSILDNDCDIRLISINGGKKTNAIPDSCTVEFCAKSQAEVLNCFNNAKVLLSEIKEYEPDVVVNLAQKEDGKFVCLDNNTKSKIIGLLKDVPDGVIKMSEEIEGLVETSLNLGILSTESDKIIFCYALRSNKEEKLIELGKQVLNIGKNFEVSGEVSGFYPPWEYKKNSPLRELYKKCYKEQNGADIKVEAIHAGLECAVFSSTIKGLDCISVGPNMFDVHTPKEKLSISSTIRTFGLILKVLKESIKF